MSETEDFREETGVLAALLQNRADEDFSRKTQFKGWTVNDVLVHLHFWNKAVALAATDEAAFQLQLQPAMAAAMKGAMRAHENSVILERGRALLSLWRSSAEETADLWAGLDPKQRIPWAGPSMSARSAITARQMETWAHGYELFDLFGVERQEGDRLRNLVVLGVNTFGWSHQVHGLPVPPAMPQLVLEAPSGAVWTFGEEGAGRISGPAAGFAAVVTQTRAFADSGLTVEGETARTWMAHAQCFAGPPEIPPAPGCRGRASSLA